MVTVKKLRFLALALTCCMLLAFLPVQAHAGGEAYRSLLIRYSITSFSSAEAGTYAAVPFSEAEGFREGVLYGVIGSNDSTTLKEEGVPPLTSVDGFTLQGPDGSTITLALYGAYGVVTGPLEQEGDYTLASYPIPEGFELSFPTAETIEDSSNGSSITFGFFETVTVKGEEMRILDIPLRKIGSDDPVALYKKYLQWKNGEAVTPPENTDPVPQDLTATPTAAAVLVNGTSVAFDAYNISGNNYFKLRDLAFVLSGSEKQFEVGWDAANNAISLTSGMAYTPVSGEMEGKEGKVTTPTPTTSTIYLDGQEVSFTAYRIDGNNYFKLRDIGAAFDFGIDWDGTANTIIIDTTKGYTP